MNVLQEYRRCHGDGRYVHHHRPGVRGRHHRGLSQEEQTPERGESLACQVINCHSSDHLLNHSTSVTLHTLHRNKYNCVTRLIKRGWIFNWLIWILRIPALAGQLGSVLTISSSGSPSLHHSSSASGVCLTDIAIMVQVMHISCKPSRACKTAESVCQMSDIYEL